MANITNGIIKSAEICLLRGCILEIDLAIITEHGIGKMNLGFVNIGKPNKQEALTKMIILLFNRINIKESENCRLSDFVGQPCRVQVEDDEIIAIGNFIENKWITQEDVKKAFGEEGK